MSGQQTVAVLGAGGTMGYPMAANLARAGFAVRAWNRSRDKAEPLTQDRVQVFGTPEQAADGAGVILTMLADTDAVLAAVDGPDGAFAAVPAAAGSGPVDADGVLWLQMSTIGEAGIERCADLAGQRDVVLVDAPVLGTKQPAEQGKLVVLASGPDDAIERCAPVFEAVGSKTLRLGEAGAGTRLKLVVNHWLLALVASLAESIKFAQDIDVDPRSFLEAISGGPVGPAYADLKGGAMIEGEFSPASFPLALAGKDLDLVLAAAERHDHELGLLPVVREQVQRAVAAGHGEDDLAALFAGV